MRQIRIVKRRLRPPGERQASLPLDPHDPDIVHADRAARRLGGTRGGRTQPGGRGRTKPDPGGR